MKKKFIFTLLLALGAFGIVFADSIKGVFANYDLRFVGANASTETISFKDKYNSTLKLTNQTRANDVQLGMSITKKTLGKFFLKIRKDKWVKDIDTYSYNYQAEGDGTYKGTVVVNDANESFYMMKGVLELY